MAMISATVSDGRHGIESAVGKRMTAKDATQCQPAAPQGAVALHRFHGVFRTTGMKTATLPEQGTDQGAIATN